jgi:hypothetical protein
MRQTTGLMPHHSNMYFTGFDYSREPHSDSRGSEELATKLGRQRNFQQRGQVALFQGKIRFIE